MSSSTKVYAQNARDRIVDFLLLVVIAICLGVLWCLQRLGLIPEEDDSEEGSWD